MKTFRIVLLFFLGGFLFVSHSFSQTPEDGNTLLPYLNQSLRSESVLQMLSNPAFNFEQDSTNEYRYNSYSTGIQLDFSMMNKKLMSVKFFHKTEGDFEAFTGILPHGFTFEMTQEQIKARGALYADPRARDKRMILKNFVEGNPFMTMTFHLEDGEIHWMKWAP